MIAIGQLSSRPALDKLLSSVGNLKNGQRS